MANTHHAITIEIKTREIIKPSSPTPPHLKTLKLSLCDQLCPDRYTPLILFYHSNNIETHQVSQNLKSSLSQNLTHFYPLAGRMNQDGISIDCNDLGVEYLEAQVSDCTIYDILQKPNHKVLRKLIPFATKFITVEKGCFLLSVQVNFFECGGFAIGLCFSHKVSDAFTFASFINSWATINRDGEHLGFPIFNATSGLPHATPISAIHPITIVSDKFSTKRCVFEKEKLAKLKSKIFSEFSDLKQPSRMEVVTALMWKCAMVASKSANNGVERHSALAQLVNLRKKLVPLLTENSMGNILGFFVVLNKEEDIKLPTLAKKLRRNLEEFSLKCKEKLKGEEASAFILNNFNFDHDVLDEGKELDFYVFTSWCRFPFYEADFSWGKPSWVTYVPPEEMKNMVFLMDAKDGDGIEAWVTLSKDEMVFFEQDTNLLEFADLDPSVE